MSTILGTVIDSLFVFSMVFIWLMLIYQFILTLGGFLFWRSQRNRPTTPIQNDELPPISILIPARNEEKVITGLLERIGQFDYPAKKLEVIVLNDGSKDSTGEIIEKAAVWDTRIRLVTIPTEMSGKGKSAVLNLGLQHATHDIIAVYDADNLPEPESLRRLCTHLLHHDHLGAVVGKFRAYNKGKNLLTRLINLETLAFQWIIQAGRACLMKITILPGTNFIIRKTVLQQAGGWDVQALCEDSELTFRIYQSGFRIDFLPAAISWEQEPETIRTWIRQRVRWARGNSYLIAKHGASVFRRKPEWLTLEILNLFILYYLFVFALLFSDLLFLLSLGDFIHLRIIGPYAQLWLLAFLLYLLEIQLAMSFEREDSLRSLALALIAYLIYTKLWIFVVLKSLWEDHVLKKKRTWVKTERFAPESAPPTEPKDHQGDPR